MFATFEFQRDEKTEGKQSGLEICLWYHETEKSWLLTYESDFQARNTTCLKKLTFYMYFDSQGKQELLTHLQFIL